MYRTTTSAGFINVGALFNTKMGPWSWPLVLYSPYLQGFSNGYFRTAQPMLFVLHIDRKSTSSAENQTNGA